MLRRTFHALALLLALAALTPAGANAAGAAGAVYALSNSPFGNSVIAYDRAADGTLTAAGTYATGGTGTGASLSSQAAVALSDDHRFLFAVNAGSDSISSFRIRGGGLELASTVPSGGDMPTSVTHRQGLLYALNAGAPNSVVGFSVARDGTLAPLGVSAPLSAAQTAPAQVELSPDGSVLAVTERATNRIATYAVGPGGSLAGPFVADSTGPTPFGFEFDKRGTLVVSDAGPGGGASSYRIGPDGFAVPVTPLVVTGQRAACWIEITKNGRYAYTTNAGSGNISGFAIGHDGSLSLLDADGVTAQLGGNPTDLAQSGNGHYLYARIGATNTIAGFRIGEDGSLSPVAAAPVAAGAAGLAGW